MKKTEEILWAAIKDIETGEAKTVSEDPVNGYLPENNKLSKINVSHQSAKYNNGRPISRPTIDSYPEIVAYIKGELANSLVKQDKEIIKDLKLKNELLKKNLSHLQKLNQLLVEENRQLVELNKKNAL